MHILFYRFAVHLHFDIVIQVVEVISAAVKSDITGLNTPGADEFAIISLHIMFIFADAKAGGVVNVVVEQSPDVRDKIRFVIPSAAMPPSTVIPSEA